MVQGEGAVSDGDAVARLAAIRSQMAAAANEARRQAADVRLIAVSKTFESSDILSVLASGHRHFGENRVQEAQGKWPALQQQFPDVTLHLIGPLQSNKAKEAVALFNAIHSIDRPKIAKAIAEEMQRQSRSLELFVQVNTGEEPQKAGVAPGETESFIAMCRTEIGLPIAGLMCIPPVEEEPAVHFAFLKTLAERCGLKRLSMGMSGDFEKAIAFGATDIRVGSAIFGRRS